MSSQWPELIPEEDHSSRQRLAVSVSCAVIGGVVGWTLLYSGLGWWGLLVGAMVVVVLAAASGRITGLQRRPETIVISLACVLISWPPLWIAAVFVRFWITGKTAGA
jgi:hypothetical protein